METDGQKGRQIARETIEIRGSRPEFIGFINTCIAIRRTSVNCSWHDNGSRLLVGHQTCMTL